MAAATALSQSGSPAALNNSRRKESQKESDELQWPGKFAENVSQVAEWAAQVDESFSKVTYGLKDMNDKYGTTFPPLRTFLSEWQGYNQNESWRLPRMAEGFRSLKRDIEGYVVRFDAWVQTTSTELKQQAQDLQKVIEDLQAKIEELDKKIIEATAALLGSAAIETVVARWSDSRWNNPAIALAERIDYNTLEQTTGTRGSHRQQEALAHVKTAFDGLKPDIALICQKLSLFGEIWSSVQAQTRAFQETLRGGMEAVTNFRFKKDVELAQKLCTPLRNGLERYATLLENR
ncbi:reovirus sigma C capsid domain-containing protein [Rhizoctonia solani]|uniref:Reovirus sigma C capsid domain-containing protein n=1 Tax=Rhizoctonia solani TaxID=456999 RepID=A0A8H8NSU4_9AGAM|nr:reovirus sigma C capsid domain-containing protein [Rhizoctonia solani]QRW17597.1 reovirus sigma C capsid domain-containing protein [Rhizoctonia solani]